MAIDAQFSNSLYLNGSRFQQSLTMDQLPEYEAYASDCIDRVKKQFRKFRPHECKMVLVDFCGRADFYPIETLQNRIPEFIKEIFYSDTNNRYVINIGSKTERSTQTFSHFMRDGVADPHPDYYIEIIERANRLGLMSLKMSMLKHLDTHPTWMSNEQADQQLKQALEKKLYCMIFRCYRQLQQNAGNKQCLNDVKGKLENALDELVCAFASTKNHRPKNQERFLLELRYLIEDNAFQFDVNGRDWQQEIADQLLKIDLSEMDKETVDLYAALVQKHPKNFTNDSNKVAKLKVGCLEEVLLPQNLLEVRSLLWKHVLSSGMKESVSRELNVELESKLEQTVGTQILKFILSGEYIPDEHLLDVMCIANQYRIHDLFHLCTLHAVNNLSIDSIPHMVETAIELNHVSFTVVCINFIQENREEWEELEFQDRGQSEIIQLIDAIALLPRQTFLFSASPEGEFHLTVKECNLLRTHILEALKVVSSKIVVLELSIQSSAEIESMPWEEVGQILDIFPKCRCLDLSQFPKIGPAPTYPCDFGKVIAIGSDQIEKLLINTCDLQSAHFEKIRKAFPNLKGFGNTSVRFSEKAELKRYLEFFADPRKEEGGKPQLLAINLRCSLDDECLDLITPYIPFLHFLMIYSYIGPMSQSNNITRIEALAARTLVLDQCLHLGEVVAPVCRYFRSNASALKQLFLPKAVYVSVQNTQDLRNLVSLTARKAICNSNAFLRLLFVPEVEHLECRSSVIKTLICHKAKLADCSNNREIARVQLPQALQFKLTNNVYSKGVDLPRARSILVHGIDRGFKLNAPNALNINIKGSNEGYFSSIIAPLATITSSDGVFFPDGKEERFPLKTLFYLIN